jgi:putative ABC transport system permease protein
METFVSDIRYAVRMWIRSPGFAVVAVLTLALGIGANTTMFSVVNATMLRPLPFPEPDRLATVWKGNIDDPKNLNIVSLPNFRDWKAQSHSFEEMALFDSAGRGYNLTSHGEPEQVSGLRVTAGFFPVLGVRPLLGRTFLPEEEEPGRDRVVVLSHGLWAHRYGADPSLVGKTIQMDGAAYTVVGVMPPGFVFQFWSGPRQLWVPAGWTRGDHERGSNSFISIARLKPGVTMEGAKSEMDVIGRALATAYPSDNAGQTVRIVPMSEIGMQGLRTPLYAMLGVVGFVLLIACVNVANLMLARAASRSRELAIRRALGAGRGRLVRQLLTESVLLACVGGACGLIVAIAGTKGLLAILPNYLRRVPLRPVDDIGISAAVLAFTSGVSILSGMLFGLAPAFASFRTDHDLNNPLKEQARGSTSGKSRLRYGLVASEVALTLVVLAGAGAMIMSVARLLGIDPGLDPKNVLVMSMSLPQEDLYYGPPGHPRFCDDLDQRAGSVPGVVSISAIAHLPLSGGGAGRGFAIEGRPDPGPKNQPGAGYSVACPNILRTLGIPLMAGREFTLRDTVDAVPVALVNESMAKRFWPGEDAVGKRFKVGGFNSDSRWITVVGVFRNIRHYGLDNEPSPSFLRPYSQAAWPFMSIVTKTVSAPGAFVMPVKSALAAIEPNQPVTGVRTMEEVVGTSVSSRRFPMLLLSGFALLALLLAAVGIAGVVGYSVVQRTPEIGVRIALGAQASDVLRLVLGHSLSWTLVGVGIGIVASFGLLELLRSMLFGVTPTDPLVLGVVSLLLISVALGASYVPARRAMRVDPVSALRGD